MAYTLSDLRDKVELHLLDATNLIWSTSIIDEAIRAALADLSHVYGQVLTLNGLDGALENNFDDLDAYVIIQGAVGYALTFRVVGRYEEATPEPALVPSVAAQAEKSMVEFRAMLKISDQRLKQTTSNDPHAPWAWTEYENSRRSASSETENGGF